jgi:hypothetical protein
MITITKCMAGFVFLMIIFVTGAYAQATRTWVSGVGDDANPCSRTAPCKTFAGAISKTAAGGEIDALDPGGFGTVTITKAITIDGSGGSIAGILASGTNGITVNAGVNDVVILRNLDIDGVGLGLDGIQFNAGKALFVENSTISGFLNFGIEFTPSGAANLSLDRTLIRQAVNGGVVVRPGASGAASATIANSRFELSLFGARAEDRSSVTIQNSIATGNTNGGFSVRSNAAAVDMNLESCVTTNNGSGAVSNGAVATLRISNTFVTHNSIGLNSVNSGTIQSFLNNRLSGNTTNGAPTISTAQQ